MAADDPESDFAPNNVRLDRLDEQILWELIRDARIPNNVLAAKLHVAPSTTLTRMKALREKGILQSTHATVDLGALGLPIQAIIAVRLRPHARFEIQTYGARLIERPHVLSVFFLAGADDFLVHVACTSPQQLRDFVTLHLSKDGNIASTQTNLVFEHLQGADRMAEDGGFPQLRAPIKSDPVPRKG